MGLKLLRSFPTDQAPITTKKQLAVKEEKLSMADEILYEPNQLDLIEIVVMKNIAQFS